MSTFEDYPGSVIIASLSTFICIFSFCISTYYTVKDNTIQIKSIKCSSIFSLISFLLSSLLQCIILYTTNITNTSKNHNKYRLLEIILVSNLIIWSMAQILMYILFTLRLYHTFKGTILQIQHKTLSNIKITFSLFLSLFIMYCIISILAYYDIIPWSSYSIISSIITIIIEISDLSLSIILIHMFIMRLFKLLILNSNEKDITIIDGTSNDKQFQINLNIDQTSILALVVKYTVLSFITIISSQIFLISCINRSISLMTNEDHYQNGLILFSICFTVNCCINSVCILLNFKFSHSWYIYICCICEKCGNGICKKNAMKKIKNQYENMETMKLEENTKQHIVEYSAL